MCHSWSRAALSNHSLWRGISIKAIDATKNRACNILEAAFKRCGKRISLGIHADFDLRWSNRKDLYEPMAQLISIAAKHAGRWRSLRITDYQTEFTFPSETLPPLTQLISLEITTRYGMNLDSFPKLHPLLAHISHTADNLRSFNTNLDFTAQSLGQNILSTLTTISLELRTQTFSGIDQHLTNLTEITYKTDSDITEQLQHPYNYPSLTLIGAHIGILVGLTLDRVTTLVLKECCYLNVKCRKTAPKHLLVAPVLHTLILGKDCHLLALCFVAPSLDTLEFKGTDYTNYNKLPMDRIWTKIPTLANRFPNPRRLKIDTEFPAASGFSFLRHLTRVEDFVINTYSAGCKFGSNKYSVGTGFGQKLLLALQPPTEEKPKWALANLRRLVIYDSSMQCRDYLDKEVENLRTTRKKLGKPLEFAASIPILGWEGEKTMKELSDRLPI